MAEVVRQDFIRKTPEFPKAREKLSDEEIGNLVSATGNNEAKAITLILMRGGNIFSRNSLHNQLISVQGIRKGWEIAKNTPFSYCFYSLAPIGLVAKEIFGTNLTTFGYSITEYGEKIGVPLAGLLLDFSERNKISLHKLFGSTASTAKFGDRDKGENTEYKNRAPTNTLKIIRELLTSPKFPTREVDIVKNIDGIEQASVLAHISRLAEAGLIEYSAREGNKPYSKYKISSDIPIGSSPTYKQFPKITKLAFNILRQHPDQYLTIEEVYNLIPQEERKEWQGENWEHISGALSLLAKQKYVDIEKFTAKKQSEIVVTDEQKVILTELLEIINGVQNLDAEILAKGRSLAGKIIANPQRISDILRRSKEASSQANQSSIKESQENVLFIIIDNPGITNKEIRKLLEEKYEKRLGIASVRVLSFLLVKQGLIKEEKQGAIKKFFYNRII